MLKQSLKAFKLFQLRFNILSTRFNNVEGGWQTLSTLPFNKIERMLKQMLKPFARALRQREPHSTTARAAQIPKYANSQNPCGEKIYLTNRFHVAVRLFSNRSQMTSKCGKNKKVAHEAQPSVSLMFLPHFDVLCDLLLNRRTATWNLFVLYNKKIKIYGKNALLFQISPL